MSLTDIVKLTFYIEIAGVFHTMWGTRWRSG